MGGEGDRRITFPALQCRSPGANTVDQPDRDALRVATSQIAALLNGISEKHAASTLAEAVMVVCAMRLRDLRGDEEARNAVTRLYARLNRG